MNQHVIGWTFVALQAVLLGALIVMPVPTASGNLITTGLYSYTRHPIYSAVLVIVRGLVLRSGNFGHLLIGAVTTWFFHRKARWEEVQLRERYLDYAAYAASTPRFVPSLSRSRRG